MYRHAQKCIIAVSLLLLTGCSIRSDMGSPSSNKNLDAVSPSSVDKEKAGYLQQSYDEWEKEDWEPNTKDTPASAKTALLCGISKSRIRKTKKS